MNRIAMAYQPASRTSENATGTGKKSVRKNVLSRSKKKSFKAAIQY
jgi:hypothetical protein